MWMQKQFGHPGIQNSYIVVTKKLDCLGQRSVFCMQMNAAEAREKHAFEAAHWHLQLTLIFYIYLFYNDGI